MAFQAPLSVQQVAIASSEMWPSVAAAFGAPFRSVARRPVPPWQPPASRTEREEAITHAQPVERIAIPDFMASVSASALNARIPARAVAHGAMTASGILSALPKGSLRYASPLSQSFVSPTSRTFSTAMRVRPFTLSPPPWTSFVGFSQQRTLFGTSWGTSSNNQRNQGNMLGHLEQTANNNPGSATAQNAFYQSLLRANMPEIMVERFQTGRYASNQACESAYMKALERIGAAETGQIGSVTGKLAGGQSHQMNQEQLQAIGQAVSARNSGGNVSMSKAGSGGKNEPLYVVVDESMGSTIF
ncbi:i-AAA protease yme1, partial [Teratosphaeriaceae sp. CCFEE 6253]